MLIKTKAEKEKGLGFQEFRGQGGLELQEFRGQRKVTVIALIRLQQRQ